MARRPWQSLRKLANQLEETVPANIERPGPWAPPAEGVRLVDGGREEDDLGTPNEIVERNVADAPRGAAVGGVVAVVAHPVVVPGRHLVGADVVERAVLL